MKRRRSGDDFSSRKKQATAIDEVSRNLSQCRIDLSSCVRAARQQLRETEIRVRQEVRASFQNRENELQATIHNQSNVIRELQQKLQQVRHGLDITKRQIEQLPRSVIEEYPQLWAKQRHDFNAIAGNYNRLYHILDS